jgi:hypothetical protein
LCRHSRLDALDIDLIDFHGSLELAAVYNDHGRISSFEVVAFIHRDRGHHAIEIRIGFRVVEIIDSHGLLHLQQFKLTH